MTGNYIGRLGRLINNIKTWISGGNFSEDQVEIAKELLDSAERVSDVKYVLEESGIGEIPEELLESSDFIELISDPSKHKRRRIGPRSSKRPVTGTEARRRKPSKASQRKVIDHRKGRNRMAG